MSHENYRIMYSINTYDCDGDMIESGIYLHLGDISIRVADDPNDFRSLIDFLIVMHDQIVDAWNAA